jgi:broad specificity phosphatase PhoE
MVRFAIPFFRVLSNASIGNAGWNCFYSEIDGNSTAEWDDAHLTQNGINQALANNALWARLFQQQGIEAPQSYYVSPLTRCLQTANLTYNGLNLPSYYPFIPTIKELLREGVSVHSCDHRQAKSYIEEAFPTYQIESTFTEYVS